jgi:aromatic ring-opening dioxygenase catalytic subunit (LigB family)
VLIVGSGLSYHNLRLFGPGAKEPSEAFDAWLAEVMAKPGAQRSADLIAWETAPFARVCHVQEDHFAPIWAAVGAAEGDAARRVYHDKGLFGGVTASSYRMG